MLRHRKATRQYFQRPTAKKRIVETVSKPIPHFYQKNIKVSNKILKC